MASTLMTSRNGMPRGVLLGAAALVAFSLLAAAVGRITGSGEPAPLTMAAVERLDLRFEDRAGGSVAVIDAADGRVVEVLGPGQGGFVRGVLRALARGRRMERVGHEEIFRLTLWADQRLTLEDPSTGERVELAGFGSTNEAAFARFLGSAVRMP